MLRKEEWGEGEGRRRILSTVGRYEEQVGRKEERRVGKEVRKGQEVFSRETRSFACIVS